MTRRVPGRLLPNRDEVVIDPNAGVGSGGQIYGPPVTLARSFIVEGAALSGTQYGRETGVTGLVYCERSAVEHIPDPASRVRLRVGSVDESSGTVRRVERFQHPEIADLLVVVLE